MIYNPSNLPDPNGDAKVDSPQDSELILDSDPSALELEKVSPRVIFEGTGTGGGRSGMLTVIGKQIVPGASVMITPHGAGTPMITVDNTKAEVAANGNMIAVPITIAVNPSLSSQQKIRLDVTVTQPVGAGTVSKTLAMLDVPVPDTAVLELQGLDELTAANISLPSGLHEFSQVTITGNLSVSDTASPLIIRTTGSIEIAGTTQLSATGDQPGPGGFAGGAGGGMLAAGGKGGGTGGGITSGGGGGFALAGGGGAGVGGPAVGDAQLTSLDAPNRGNGGAGGNGGTLSSGGNGGGGGGSVELTAGGTITVGQIDAKGGNGATGANTGGGGSGGVVLLRSGVSITATAINVAGGTGGNTGSVGRIRTDAPTVPTTVPVAYRGPMFATATPVITRQEVPTISVTGEPNNNFKYLFFNDEVPTSQRGPFDQSISAGGTNSFPLAQPLFRGLNTLCLLVDGASLAAQKPEARNCIQIVYVFTE